MVISELLLSNCEPSRESRRWTLTGPNRVFQDKESERLRQKKLACEMAVDLLLQVFQVPDDESDVPVSIVSCYRMFNSNAMEVISDFKTKLFADSSESFWRDLHRFGCLSEMRVIAINAIPKDELDYITYQAVCQLSNLTPMPKSGSIIDFSKGMPNTILKFMFNYIDENCGFFYSFVNIFTWLYFRVTAGFTTPLGSMMFNNDPIYTLQSKTDYPGDSGRLTPYDGYVNIHMNEDLYIYHLSKVVDETLIHRIPWACLPAFLNADSYSKQLPYVTLNLEQAKYFIEFVLFGFKGEKQNRDINFWHAYGITPEYLKTRYKDYYGMINVQDPNIPSIFDLSSENVVLNGRSRLEYGNGGFESKPDSAQAKGISRTPSYQIINWSSKDFSYKLTEIVSWTKESESDKDYPIVLKPYLAEFYHWDRGQKFIYRPLNSLDMDFINMVHESSTFGFEKEDMRKIVSKTYITKE